MIRTVIIDDEPHIRETMAKLLNRHCPETRVVGEASGVRSGISIIRESKPDLVLLDINMGDGTGFDILHAVAPVNFRVIFVSSLDAEMIKAFRLSGIEYLLKPVNQSELKSSVCRVMQTEIGHFELQLQALEEDSLF